MANNNESSDFNRDIRKYNHKIYSIGLHEFGISREGYIYNLRMGLQRDNNFAGRFFRGDGSVNHIARNSVPVMLEQHIIDYPHIEWHLQPVCFGWSSVKPLLDNESVNPEGRLPQNQLSYELNLLFDLFSTSRNTGTPLNIIGLELDIEATMSGDPDAIGYDDKFVQLLQKIKQEVVIPRNLKYRINTFAQWGRNNPFYYRFHNYEKLAEASDHQGNALVDEIQIMTYDFAWSGSAPGASTPVYWFRNVANWAKKCFDPKENPKSKLSMDKIFLGSAGYGVRWGIFNPEERQGRNITFRNLIGWQNGYYRHFHQNEDGVYVYHHQEYLQQAAFEDFHSKNQIMLPHVYDILSAKYGDITGHSTARDYYNSKHFATTYSRSQQGEFGNVVAVLTEPDTIDGKFAPMAPLTKKVNNQDYIFNGFIPQRRQFIPKFKTEDGQVVKYCDLEEVSEASAIYNVQASGTYKVIALLGFPWYSNARIGGTINGQSFNFGSNLPDYYPLYFKQSHWAELGTYTFNGEGSIIINGEACDSGVHIFGFVLSQTYKHSFQGGAIDFNTNVQPFAKKDKSSAPIPSNLVLSLEVLRQDARPAILWEDRFGHYLNDDFVVENGLHNTTYYLRYGTRTTNGATFDDSLGYDRCIGTITSGHSTGTWQVNNDAFGSASAVGSGDLVFNKQFIGNLQVEATLRLEQGNEVGVRFGGTAHDNGYIFIYNYSTHRVRLVHQSGGTMTTVVQEAYAYPRTLGERLTLKVQMYNGRAYCFVGTVRVFSSNGIALDRTAGGACGVYSPTPARVYVLGISTLDRWEPMEKFEIQVDGNIYKFGEESRNNIQYDEWGYLMYSGRNEINTRVNPNQFPKDYTFHIQEISGFQGSKNLKIKFVDPGLWFANCYVGDAQGCSIMYAGDSYTFNNLMNIAVEEYGAKGIGLWTLGQEDPQVFEIVPDTK